MSTSKTMFYGKQRYLIVVFDISDVFWMIAEWACPKCTLFNSIVESSCAACGEYRCNGDNVRTNQTQGLIQPLNENLSSHADQKNVTGTSYANKKNKAGPSYADQVNVAGPSFNDQTNVAGPSDSDELNFERVLKQQQINYLELISMELKDIIPNVECFECPICIMDCNPYEGVILRDCLHTFCKNCLIKTIEYSTEVEVKCPFKDDNYSCNSSLQEREIKALVRPEIFQKYLAKAISVAESRIENTFHCKTPNCTGFCIFEDNVNQYCCEVCGKINCLTCQVIHMGLNCRQYQELLVKDSKTNKEAEKTRVMLEKMLQDGNAISCPTCKIIIMKKTGCDFLSCSMCGTGICWVTRGPRWGPKGYGDLSGGCRCGLFGRRCHPNCKNCH